MNRSSPNDVPALQLLRTRLTLIMKGHGEGAMAEARRLIHGLALRRFGEPGPAHIVGLAAIQEPDQLETIAEWLGDLGIQSWDDLLHKARVSSEPE
jgi:hypothetical protein